MNIHKIIFLLFSITGFSQPLIKLRDVSFDVPRNFKYLDKANVKEQYDLFYENGKISVDSSGAEFFPKIAYQYYENPGSTEDSEAVLKGLNDIMIKDFKPDTLIINGDDNFSISKYRIQGNTLFEIKSLGENGWLNIAYIDRPEKDKITFAIVKKIAESVHHQRKYNQTTKRNAYVLLFVIIGLCILVFVTGVKKMRRKKSPNTR
ncbi:MAG: hypothetical protein EOP00_36720 [Pedobacter sp.]|nr:MAG: hypothetical protein EOP00_36720 [Pedobacter sp.]